MRLHGVAAILLLSLCTVTGLRCYVCVSTDPCLTYMTCPDDLDYCSSLNLNSLHVKSCLNSTLCVFPLSCCQTDLCNGARPTDPSVVLLLVSSAVITLLL